MMQHAVELTTRGHAVYVAFNTRSECAQWEKWRATHAPMATSIQFDTVSRLDIDWHTMKLRGAHENCRLLVDHYSIQTQFQAMLDMFHAYDLTEL